MTTLSLNDARALVRKNLDELDPNGSIMYSDENPSSPDYADNKSLDDIIGRYLPEAINAVHLAAPVALLEGTAGTAVGPTISTDKVLKFSLATTTKFLRLVAFRAADSDIVVTEVIPESSPEGRKQQNTHIRGRADRPRLVMCQDLASNISFRYYSISASYSGTASSAIAQFSYIPEVTYSSEATGYNISYRLKQNIIDLLTARVLETYNDARYQNYIQRANNFPTL